MQEIERETGRTEIVFVEEDHLIFIHSKEKRCTFFVGAEAGVQIKNVCACLTVSVSLCVHLSLYVR